MKEKGNRCVVQDDTKIYFEPKKHIMKRTALYLIATLAMVFSLSFAFSGCESDLTDLAGTDDINAIAATRDATGKVLPNTCDCIFDNFPNEELSDDEISALVFMREEEKLAHDVYLKLFETWNDKAFFNIANSEQKHMDAILCLLNKYGLEDPVGSNPPGTFEDVNLAALYSALVATGSESLENALRVGATIEDLDIADLLNEIEKADNADVIAVFGELTKGSRNHLRAFTGKLVNLGYDAYVPQYIPQEMFDDITNSPRETGSSICDKNAGTNKPGKGNPKKGPKSKGGPQ